MNQTGSEMPSRVDKILDLLLDALLERQMARRAGDFLPPKPEAIEVPPPEPEAVEIPPPQPDPPAARMEPPQAVAERPVFTWGWGYGTNITVGSVA